MASVEITVLDGATAGVALRSEALVRIGSDPACEIVLPDAGVDPVHATVEPGGRGWVLRSAPGVGVGAVRERQRGERAHTASLASLAFLDVGPVTLLFHQLDGAYIPASTITEKARALRPRLLPTALPTVAWLSRGRASTAIAMLDDDRLLVAGGQPPMGGESFANADVVSLAAGTTREIALLVARAAARATRLRDGRVVISGGTTDAVEILDPRTLTTTLVAPMHVARAGGAAVLLAGDRVLVLGGQHTRSPHVAEVYDAARDTWTLIPGPPLSYVELARLDEHRVLIANDRGVLGPLPETAYFVLDTRTFSFEPIAAPARTRRGPHLVSLGEGRAVVVGGTPPSGLGGSRAVDVFDLATGSFTPTCDLRAMRMFQGVVALDRGRVLVIGGDSAYAGLYSAEVLDVNRGVASGLPAVREGMNPMGAVSLGDTAVVVGYEQVALARGEAWSPRLPDGSGERVASRGGITFRSSLACAPRGLEHADVWSPRPGGAAVVALIHGIAGYCGDSPTLLSHWVLGELLGEPVRGLPLPVETTAPPLAVHEHLLRWTAHVLDRSPLPADPLALPRALAARLDTAFVAMNSADPHFRAFAEGAIAVVVPGLVRLVRRGAMRVYRVRDGQVSLVVDDHVRLTDLLASGQITREMLEGEQGDELRRIHRGVRLSGFGNAERAEPAFDIATEPGDRLVLASVSLYRNVRDDEFAAAVADPSFAALTAWAEREERGHGVVSITVSG